MPSVIALDAMGSDRAPKPEIEGAIQAARHYGVRVSLVGNEATIRAELSRYPAASGLPLEIIHASEVITMEDKAVQAVRAKRDSSMRVGLRLVREGRATGFVTAGNTGAAMATAKMVLGGITGSRSSRAGCGFPYRDTDGRYSAGCWGQRRLHARESGAVRGYGRNLLSQHVRHAAS